ncbi:MAG: M20/M25/M40 family metallo-hydrolase [Paracoccaceae bacterium]
MNTLPDFSEADLLGEILDWVRIESPTFAPERVERMQAHAADSLRPLGFSVERLPGGNGLAGCTVCRRPGSGDAPALLVIGHLDTVHPVGTLDGPLPIRREGDRCYGPGIYDMKAGIVMAFAALKALVAQGRLDRSVTVLLNGDEEVGSPVSRALIEREARRHAHVLIPEPAFLETGEVTTGRHAFHRYTIETHGRPAHSGWTNKEGRSAIRVMAQIIEALEDRSDFEAGPTYSVGVVGGGRWVNCVPKSCRAEVLCVARSDEKSAEIGRVMAELEGERHGVRISVEKGPVRPLWTAGKGTLALYERARAIAGEIGFDLPHGQHGGGSDGNFTGVLGVPTLDGLGAMGHGAHTTEERILISSLVPRTKVLAGLMADPGRV